MNEENKSKILSFVNPEKGHRHYIKRYLTEPNYKDWFDKNYPNYTIYEGIGISKEEYEKIAHEFIDERFDDIELNIVESFSETKDAKESILESKDSESTLERSEIVLEENSQEPKQDTQIQTLLETVSESDSSENSSRMSFEQFVDERLLVSHDAFGSKQMKIKILEVSDEHPPVQWKFGDRVKVTKILITIKHLDTQQVEEGEFDIEAIERELAEKSHYTSTNRWVPANEIKNGYIVGSRHTSLISDAVALDYIVF